MQAKDRIKRALQIILEAGYQVTPEALKAFSHYENPEELAKELILKIEENSENIIVIDDKYINLLEEKYAIGSEIEKTKPQETHEQIGEKTKTEVTAEKTQEVSSKITKSTESSTTTSQALLTQESPKRYLAKDIDA
ncbi:MAG: hypothetical protein KIH08_04480, partial [Candidatus Freyarchaeota archaeon]|nr:hypothetical protein [Candidatus Jordarchaeia archaeon]